MYIPSELSDATSDRGTQGAAAWRSSHGPSLGLPAEPAVDSKTVGLWGSFKGGLGVDIRQA